MDVQEAPLAIKHVLKRLSYAFSGMPRPDPGYLILHLQPQDAPISLMMALIHDQALRQSWNEQNSVVLASFPSSEHDDILSLAKKLQEQAYDALNAYAWERAIWCANEHLGWALIETPQNSMVFVSSFGAPKRGRKTPAYMPLLRALHQDGLQYQLLLPHPKASSHERLSVERLYQRLHPALQKTLASCLPAGVHWLEYHVIQDLQILCVRDKNLRRCGVVGAESTK